MEITSWRLCRSNVNVLFAWCCTIYSRCLKSQVVKCQKGNDRKNFHWLSPPSTGRQNLYRLLNALLIISSLLTPTYKRWNAMEERGWNRRESRTCALEEGRCFLHNALHNPMPGPQGTIWTVLLELRQATALSVSHLNEKHTSQKQIGWIVLTLLRVIWLYLANNIFQVIASHIAPDSQ